jgi:2-methylcitrate dehydratase PrpD
LMARHGIYAAGAALEGRAGLFAAHFAGTFDENALAGNLGTRFQSLDRCFKAMPGTLVSHAFAEAALALVRSHAIIGPERIARVELEVGPWGRSMCEPFDLRRAPTSGSAAMNSIPFAVAKALANGIVALEDFTPSGLRDARTLAVAQRISHKLDETLARPNGIEPGIVTLYLNDGRVLREEVEVPLGHPARPFAPSDAERKFRTNLGLGARPLKAERIEALIQTIMSLEDLTDPGAFFALIGA